MRIAKLSMWFGLPLEPLCVVFTWLHRAPDNEKLNGLRHPTPHSRHIGHRLLFGILKGNFSTGHGLWGVGLCHGLNHLGEVPFFQWWKGEVCRFSFLCGCRVPLLLPPVYQSCHNLGLGVICQTQVNGTDRKSWVNRGSNLWQFAQWGPKPTL